MAKRNGVEASALTNFVGAFVFGVSCSAGAMAQSALGETELRKEIVGKSVLWDDGATTSYQADGTYTFKRRDGVAGKGKWTLSGDRLCVEIVNNRPGCFQFFKDSQGLSVINSRGNKYKLTLIVSEAGSGTEGTLRECEQSVTYTIEKPASNLFENVRSYSGVWVGEWYTGPGSCSALVIEGLYSDGTARVLYVWGALPQFNIKSGSIRYSGKMEDNPTKIWEKKLRAGYGDISLLLNLRGNDLEGRYFDKGILRARGSFSRR